MATCNVLPSLSTPISCMKSSTSLRLPSFARGFLQPASFGSISVKRHLVKRRQMHKSYKVSAVFSPEDDPVLQGALKEPVAFFGGLFAGLLRLDLKEDPLREWVARTAEAAGINTEEEKEEESDDGPIEISIE